MGGILESHKPYVLHSRFLSKAHFLLTNITQGTPCYFHAMRDQATQTQTLIWDNSLKAEDVSEKSPLQIVGIVGS